VVHPDQENEKDLRSETGLTERQLRRVLQSLVGAGKWGIKRKRVVMPGKGTNPMGYWI